METRSKARGDAGTHTELARATPEAPVQQASSELSLNLEILIDDEVTGAVGPDHSTGERPSRPPGNTLEGQSQVAAGIKPVSEPVKQSSVTGENEQITAERIGDATVGTAGKPPIPTHYSEREREFTFPKNRRFLPRCMECRRGLAMRIILSVCLSVRPSNAWIVTKRKKDMFRFLYHTKDNLS